MTVRDWSALAWPDFAGLNPERTVAVLLLGAIEQHGAHLPLGTDAVIGEGLWRETAPSIAGDLDVLVLPSLAVTKSDEHIASPGTLTLRPHTMIDVLGEIGASVARAGVRKLLVLSSHGGNSEVMGIAARSLRIEHAMFVVATNWARLGYPPGLFTAEEMRFGIHGGEIETSLMLHLAPELVRMDAAPNARALSAAMAERNAVLEGAGRNGFAWIAQDLHDTGVCGDATSATAEAGVEAAAHAARRVATLITEMADFPLGRLSPVGG